MTAKQMEEYVIKYANYFCTADRQLLFPRAEDSKTPMEGRDGYGIPINANDNGNIEVKVINSFLTRGNDNNELTGTIPLEIYALCREKEIQDAIKDGRDPDFPGWLFAVINPIAYRHMRIVEGWRATADAFDRLAFILKDNNSEPFACIMFEDIPRLCRCLVELLPPIINNEWTIERTDKIIIPARNDRKYWGKYELFDKHTGGIIKTMWHIPFRRISHLATVTMIGNDPRILQTQINDHEQLITEELQIERLEYLKKCAHNMDGSVRRLSIDEIVRTDPRGRYIDLSAIEKFNINNPKHERMKAIQEAGQINNKRIAAGETPLTIRFE